MERVQSVCLCCNYCESGWERTFSGGLALLCNAGPCRHSGCCARRVNIDGYASCHSEAAPGQPSRYSGLLVPLGLEVDWSRKQNGWVKTYYMKMMENLHAKVLTCSSGCFEQAISVQNCPNSFLGQHAENNRLFSCCLNTLIKVGILYTYVMSWKNRVSQDVMKQIGKQSQSILIHINLPWVI